MASKRKSLWIPFEEQNKFPNFVGDDGEFYLVRCFCCGNKERGTENYGPAVSSGECAWCGWSREKVEGK